MTHMKKTIAGLAFMVGFSILMTGCERNEKEGNHNGPIRITVNAANATKAAAITTSSLETAGKFVLDVFATDEWTEVDDDGKPITGTEHSAGSYISSGGAANVLYSSANNPYTPYDAARPDDDYTEGWYIYDAKSYEYYNWINGIKLRFWARYPQDSEINVNGASLSVSTLAHTSTTETFTYSLPTHVAGSDATNQQDILFAYNERTKQKEDDNDDIDLTFNHPLSEIRFCVSPDDGTFDVSLQIKSIEITQVPDGGSCVFNPAGTITGTTKMFTWTPVTEALHIKNYSQDYNAGFDAAPSGWVGTEYDATNHYHIYTCQNAFMLIPHTTGSTTKIKITFWDTVEETDVIREQSIEGTAWKPGYYYTYKIKATKIGRSVTSYVVLTDWNDHDSKINIPC